MIEKVGYIILFHFDPPFKHAKHCWDWAEDVNERVRRHYAKLTRGPLLIHRALDAGSKLKVDRTFGGTKSDMLKLRKAGNANKLCRQCKQERRMKWQEDHLSELLAESIQSLKSSSG